MKYYCGLSIGDSRAPSHYLQRH